MAAEASLDPEGAYAHRGGPVNPDELSARPAANRRVTLPDDREPGECRNTGKKPNPDRRG